MISGSLKEFTLIIIRAVRPACASAAGHGQAHLLGMGGGGVVACGVSAGWAAKGLGCIWARIQAHLGSGLRSRLGLLVPAPAWACRLTCGAGAVAEKRADACQARGDERLVMVVRLLKLCVHPPACPRRADVP